jgi:peptidyl-prolyl cis-trans isomerase B (cyclophilin B)
MFANLGGVSRARLLLLAVPALLIATACGNDSGGSSDAVTADATASTSPTATSPSQSPGSGASTDSAGSGVTAGAPSGSGASGGTVTCSYPSDGNAAAKEVDPPPSKPVATSPTKATISTNRGAIRVTLEADRAPCTVNSFLSLGAQGYFDDTRCHRLTTAGIFVLQCGDPTGSGAGTPGYSFADELVKDDPRVQPCRSVDTAMGKQDICTYPAGTVAMANAGKDTNGSQFFLVYRDSPLPNAYTVFGRMDASGLKVVQQVARAGISNESQAQGDGPPQLAVTITSVKPTS